MQILSSLVEVLSLPSIESVQQNSGDGIGRSYAPGHGGDDMDVDWSDVFSEQQDQTFAFLVEMDNRHEQSLYLEKRRQADLSMTRPSMQAPLARRIVKASRSSDSIEVVVDGGDSSAIHDEVFHDRCDNRSCSTYRVVPCRPSCVLFSRFLGNGKTSTSDRAPPSPRGGS
ncbi:hypothetical protein MRX96_048390 [Rhipicephalus microplus]